MTEMKAKKRRTDSHRFKDILDAAAPHSKRNGPAKMVERILRKYHE